MERWDEMKLGKVRAGDNGGMGEGTQIMNPIWLVLLHFMAEILPNKASVFM